MDKKCLVVAKCPGTNEDSIYQLLQLGHVPDIAYVDLNTWQPQTSNEHLLYFYSRPEKFIQKAIENQGDSDEALSEWVDEIATLLKKYKGQRAQVSILMLEAVQKKPSQWIQWLNEKTNQTTDASSAPQIPLPELTQNLELLLASQLVRQDERLQALLPELEASSSNAADLLTPLKINCIQIITQGKYSSGLQEENEHLLLQLQQVQEELEKVYIRKQDAEKRTNEQFKALETSLEKLKSKYQLLLNSTSWRLTKPLRALVRLMKGQPMRKKARLGGKK